MAKAYRENERASRLCRYAGTYGGYRQDSPPRTLRQRLKAWLERVTRRAKDVLGK